MTSILRGHWHWTTGGSRWHLAVGIGAPLLALLALALMGDDETRESLASRLRCSGDTALEESAVEPSG